MKELKKILETILFGCLYYYILIPMLFIYREKNIEKIGMIIEKITDK